ncbi:L,D-transpeptidase [Paenibacillus cymbidii]|uniref:L,D-transpeptidase n=1 Tax=Paenibacillus cymbidii TaxID=1639034 RepID=UPI00108199D0|nr:L,D-transpeptidase [Paenibacillus cymbidii]
MDDDQQYLKDYIKRHQGNKMGWYLLGKEYAAQGKHSKAQYCFEQAGEVYEAFEKQPLPQLPPEEARQAANIGRHAAAAAGNQPLRRAVRISLAVLLFLLLVTYIPYSETPSRMREANTGLSPSIKPVAVPAAAERVLYTHALQPKADTGELFRDMLLPQANRWSFTVIAKGQPTPDNRWIDWRKPALPLVSLERSAVTGQPEVSYYDAATCHCQAEDAGRASRLVKDWVEVQEQEAVLRSAIASYASLYGEPPASIDKLTGDYPRNVLPGYTDYMAGIYPQLVAAFRASAATGSTPAPSAQPARPATATEAPVAGGSPLAPKLEIIIDKQTHRLALVSGNIMVRSYPVGLGGSKTPEGTFVISEKVKNPNGRSDGDFGSRGMTLSDSLYAIHGTNRPDSIGLDQSLGCVRMNKADVEELFDMAPLGTKVTIGDNLLSDDNGSGKPSFALPALREETNPNKVYHWLE